MIRDRFGDVLKMSIELHPCRETLSKSSNDWKVRIEALQMLRSLLLAGAANYDEMYNALRTLDVPFQVSFPSLIEVIFLMKNSLQDGAFNL